MKTPYWTLAIERARVRVAKGKPAFTKRAKELAANWITCACGRQDSRIPLFDPNEPNYGPFDDELRFYGSMFLGDVCNDNIDSAEKYLALIEIRAAEVIAEGIA